MAIESLKHEPQQGNNFHADAQLAEIAKKFISIENNWNSKKGVSDAENDALCKQLANLAKQAEAIEAEGPIGIISKIAISTDEWENEEDLRCECLYNRIAAHSFLAAREFIENY